MATTAAPYGARPIGTLSASGSFTSQTRHLPIITTYGTQISNGDFVKSNKLNLNNRLSVSEVINKVYDMPDKNYN